MKNVALFFMQIYIAFFVLLSVATYSIYPSQFWLLFLALTLFAGYRSAVCYRVSRL